MPGSVRLGRVAGIPVGLHYGRLIIATLWGLYGDGERATQHAARAGQAFAVPIIAFGLSQFYSVLGWAASGLP